MRLLAGLSSSYIALEAQHRDFPLCRSGNNSAASDVVDNTVEDTEEVLDTPTPDEEPEPAAEEEAPPPPPVAETPPPPVVAKTPGESEINQIVKTLPPAQATPPPTPIVKKIPGQSASTLRVAERVVFGESSCRFEVDL